MNRGPMDSHWRRATINKHPWHALGACRRGTRSVVCRANACPRRCCRPPPQASGRHPASEALSHCHCGAIDRARRTGLPRALQSPGEARRADTACLAPSRLGKRRPQAMEWAAARAHAAATHSGNAFGARTRSTHTRGTHSGRALGAPECAPRVCLECAPSACMECMLRVRALNTHPNCPKGVAGVQCLSVPHGGSFSRATPCLTFMTP